MNEHKLRVLTRYLCVLVLIVGPRNVTFKQISVLLQESLRPTFSQSVQVGFIHIDIVILVVIYLELVVVLLNKVVGGGQQLLSTFLQWVRSIASSFFDIDLYEITILLRHHVCALLFNYLLIKYKNSLIFKNNDDDQFRTQIFNDR